jgi:hypothetical protein
MILCLEHLGDASRLRHAHLIRFNRNGVRIVNGNGKSRPITLNGLDLIQFENILQGVSHE